MATMIQSMDKDGDNKISREEAPSRLADSFDTIDANSDGFLEASEMIEAFKKFAPGGGG